MRAIVYTRVSSDPRNKGRSVAEQLAECRQVCGRENWEIVKVLTDNDRSASRYARKTRPGFEELQTLIPAHAAEVLVTWEASRFQRDLEAYVQLRELCRQNGVLWSYSGRTYDLTRTDDRLSTGIDALLAERESDITSERVLRAVRSNAANGRPHGKNVYGYSREYDPETRELDRVVVNPQQAAVLHEVRDRFMTGESFYELARDLTARGVPRPLGHQQSPRGEDSAGVWWATNLARLMKNPTYVGKRTHNGVIVGDAIWPPIFTPDEWWPLQSRLADPARKSHRGGNNLAHLLTGIAVCGQPRCGAKVKLVRNRGNLSYMCSAKFHVSRKEVDVDAVVVKAIRARFAMPDALQVLAEQRTPDSHADSTQLTTLRARLESFVDSAADGGISPSALARIEAKLTREIKAIEARMQRAALPAVFQRLAGVDIAQQWDDLGWKDKRDLVDAAMTVTILPIGKGRRAFDPESVAIAWRD